MTTRQRSTQRHVKKHIFPLSPVHICARMHTFFGLNPETLSSLQDLQYCNFKTIMHYFLLIVQHLQFTQMDFEHILSEYSKRTDFSVGNSCKPLFSNNVLLMTSSTTQSALLCLRHIRVLSETRFEAPFYCDCVVSQVGFRYTLGLRR